MLSIRSNLKKRFIFDSQSGAFEFSTYVNDTGYCSKELWQIFSNM